MCNKMFITYKLHVLYYKNRLNSKMPTVKLLLRQSNEKERCCWQFIKKMKLFWVNVLSQDKSAVPPLNVLLYSYICL